MVATSMGNDNDLEPTSPEGTSSGAEDSDAPRAGAADDVPNDVNKLAGSGAALTPGQRLAAKKAQKAIEKREFKAEIKQKAETERAQEQEQIEQVFGRAAGAPALPPDHVQEVAASFSTFLQGHRGALAGGALAVVAVGFAWIYGRNALSSGSAEQAALLATAEEIAGAPLDPSDEDGKTDDGKPLFKTFDARARAASDAYTRAIAEKPSSLAASWARLGSAAVAIELGRFEDAQKTFEGVYAESQGKGLLAARALEGLGIAYEAAGKSDEAQKRFESLKALGKGIDTDLGEYHLARLKLSAGDRDGAKTLLKGVYDRLAESAASGDRSRYLKGEVEVRLAELDSSLVPAAAASPGAQQFSPEELQRLIQQMQQQGGMPKGADGE